MNPRLPAIESYLDLDYLTEVVATFDMNYERDDNLQYTVARGAQLSSSGVAAVRPMFQIMSRSHEGSAHQARQVPCQRCGDFSRSWSCPEHQQLAASRGR